MFTTEHFIWMGLCAVFVALLSLISVKRKWPLKTAGLVMTGICLASETGKILSDMLASPLGGMHLDPLCLPFHLCSLLIFAVPYVTFARPGKAKSALVNFIAVIGTLGSVCAILIPTNGTDFTTPLAYQCFVYHAGLLWFALYLLFTRQAQPGSVRALGQNLGLLLALTFAMLYVNGALSMYDTNFFYVTRPPMENLPFLNLNQGWYVYFGRLVALGTAALCLFHLPFILRARRAAGRTAVAAAAHK